MLLGATHVDTQRPTVPFAHDCRKWDGSYRLLVAAREALAGSRYDLPVYRCVDPSLADQFPTLGTEVRGYRVPPGGNLERGINRWSSVFERKLATVPGDLLHIWTAALARVARYRSDVVVTIPDIAKWTTRYYGPIPSYLHNRVLPFVKQARAVVVYAEWTRQDVIRALGISPERVHVAPPALDWPRPYPQHPVPAEPPTESAPWTMLYVAVDRPHKNVRFFLDVLAKLDRRFRGRIVTHPTSETQHHVRRRGLEGRVEFLADLPDMRPVYTSSDLLLFPSLFEGFGIPVLEAMGCGLPVIASDVTVLPEVVAGGGVCLPLGDADRWASAVLRLADLSQYRLASRAALERADQYSPVRYAGALDQIYRSALS